jgi:hypothetical protein
MPFAAQMSTQSSVQQQPPPPQQQQQQQQSNPPAPSLKSAKPSENDFCGVEDSSAGVYDLFKWEVPSFDSWLGVPTKRQEVSLELVLL